MSQTLGSSKHDALRRFIIEKRKKAKLRQVDVARRLGRYQSYVTNIETGQRRAADVLSNVDAGKAVGGRGAQCFDRKRAVLVPLRRMRQKRFLGEVARRFLERTLVLVEREHESLVR